MMTRSGERGWTIVELIVVVAVCGAFALVFFWNSTSVSAYAARLKFAALRTELSASVPPVTVHADILAVDDRVLTGGIHGDFSASHFLLIGSASGKIDGQITDGIHKIGIRFEYDADTYFETFEIPLAELAAYRGSARLPVEVHYRIGEVHYERAFLDLFVHGRRVHIVDARKPVPADWVRRLRGGKQ